MPSRRLDAALEGGAAGAPHRRAGRNPRALDELNAAYSAAGASLYQSAPGPVRQAARASPAAAARLRAAARAGRAKDDVVEADYEIVDEKK